MLYCLQMFPLGLLVFHLLMNLSQNCYVSTVALCFAAACAQPDPTNPTNCLRQIRFRPSSLWHMSRSICMIWNANSVKITAILVLRPPFVARLRLRHAYSSSYSAVHWNIVVDKFSSAPPSSSSSSSTRLSLYTLCHFEFRSDRCICRRTLKLSVSQTAAVNAWLFLCVDWQLASAAVSMTTEDVIRSASQVTAAALSVAVSLDIGWTSTRAHVKVCIVITFRLRPDKFHRARRKSNLCSVLLNISVIAKTFKSSVYSHYYFFQLTDSCLILVVTFVGFRSKLLISYSRSATTV